MSKYIKVNFQVVLSHKSIPSPDHLLTSLPILCMVIGCDIAGDGFCDDATNDARCNFDGGDCCIPDKNTEYCQFCLCYADQPEGNL